MAKLSKAAAKRWLAANVGKNIDTRQTQTIISQSREDSGSVKVWEPGTRTLQKRGSRYQLNESYISDLGADVTILELTENTLTFESVTEFSNRENISTTRTQYTLA